MTTTNQIIRTTDDSSDILGTSSRFPDGRDGICDHWESMWIGIDQSDAIARIVNRSYDSWRPNYDSVYQN